jgi:hypothetical protein
MDKSSAAYFWCVFAVILCVNVPFIVCDLVYAGDQGGACADAGATQVGISITLATWLEVDGYCRLAIVGLFLLCAISACINVETALKLFMCTICTMILYSLFNLAWLIVGSVLFWGDLNQQEVCQNTSLQSYMYAVLILGYIGVCSSLFSSNNQRG